jgi:hypothetical protein
VSWDQILSLFALLLASVAIWRAEELARYLHISDNTPNKAWKKRVSQSKHQVAHKQDAEIELQGADELDRAFLSDFWGVADYLNAIYANDPWSFENSGRVEAGLGTASREIEIRYNEQVTGFIKISSIKNFEFPVRLKIELLNARHFDCYEIMGIAETAAFLVCDVDEIQRVRQQVQGAMLQCVWQLGAEAIGNPEFSFEIWGSAKRWQKIQQSVR